MQHEGGSHQDSALAYCLPWAELAEVRIFPSPYLRRPGQRPPADDGTGVRHVILAFVFAQPAAALNSMRLSWVRRLGASRVLRSYGTPVAIGDRVLDHTGGQIMAAVSGFAPAPVPVHRYD